MKRRRLFWVLLAIVVLVGVAFADKGGDWKQLFSTGGDSRYTDLDTALTPEKAQGWKVSVPPKQEGPYRRVSVGPVIGRDPKDGIVCRLRDAKGNVVEEIDLHGTEDFDQTVVYLETRSGQQTVAVLKRAR